MVVSGIGARLCRVAVATSGDVAVSGEAKVLHRPCAAHARDGGDNLTA